MISIHKILCPVDFSEVTRFALEPARSAAREFGAELLLLHVLEHPHPYVGGLPGAFDVESYYDQVEEEATSRLPKLLAADGGPSIPSRSIVTRGIPDEVVASVAEEEEVDLIVLTTHARTGVDHWLLGSVAEKIVRLAPCPVLTVSPRQEKPSALHPKTILFATDFSEHSNRALSYAVSLAEHYGAELVMVHVVTVWNADPANPSWRFPPLPPEHQDAIEADVQRRLDKSLGQVESSGVKARTKSIRGFDPGLNLLSAAEEEGADLIVLATHGRLGLAHMLIGSTAEKVIRYSACPVLSIKHPEKEFWKS